MPAAVIDTDVPCFQCRYNLRSLHVNARCPECGTAVFGSLLNATERAVLAQEDRVLARAARARKRSIGILVAMLLCFLISFIVVPVVFTRATAMTEQARDNAFMIMTVASFSLGCVMLVIWFGHRVLVQHARDIHAVRCSQHAEQRKTPLASRWHDRIVRKLEAYRRDRKNAIALGLIGPLLLVVFVPARFAMTGGLTTTPDSVGALWFSMMNFFACPFWLAIAWVQHMRLWHARSIQLHRRNPSAAITTSAEQSHDR